MGKKSHGEYFLSVIMDGRDESVIVGDIENGDGAVAFNGHLVGVGEALACLREILPASSSCNFEPMVEWCACFGVDLFCFFEKPPGEDAHDGASHK
jgi:hypothetical protein